MSILKMLGMRKTAQPVQKKQIQLHPECMAVHSTLVSMWLSGSAVEVLNPDGEWEDCPNPVFDPQYQYRLKNIGVVEAPAVTRPMEDNPIPVPPAPAVPLRYKRGDICTNAHGHTYLVLGSKYDLLPNYDPTNDPDSGSLVVIRSQEGTKASVNCRTPNGAHKSRKAQFALGDVVRRRALTSVDQYLQNTKGFLKIYIRNHLGMSDVYLDRSTGEVRFF